mgnify:CR=1 FL=1
MADTPLTVTSAALTISTPTTTSVLDRAVAIASTALQPTIATVSFALVMGLTVVSIQPVPSAVALNWQQSGSNWVIDVAAATIAPVPYTVEGSRGTPVVTAIPTLSGSTVNLAYQRMFVDSGAPSILGQDVGLEENQFFGRAAPTIAGQAIALSKGTPVVSATPTIAGSNITLTPSVSPAFSFVSATPTIAPQDITLNLNFSLASASASFSVIGSNVNLQWQQTNAVNVAEAHPVLTPSDIVLARAIPFTTATPSIAGQTIGFRYDWVLPVVSLGPELDTPFGPVGQEIGLSFPFALGLTTELLNVTFVGQDIALFLGSGEPTTIKVAQTSPSIQISLGAPITVATTNSENIQSG